MTGHPLAANIRVGEHWTASFFGLTVNVDTILATVVSGLIVIALGVWLSRTVTSGVPNGIQLFWETVVSFVEDQVAMVIGPTAPFVVPLAVALFTFILVANWLEFIPTGYPQEYLPPATADVNTTFALALLVIVMVHVYGIRRHGLRRYVRGFLSPPLLAPIHIISEIAKPITLALRLFGNLFAGGIMLAILALLPWLVLVPAQVIWKLFDIGFIGLIQAFIFALLSILYFGFAAEGH